MPRCAASTFLLVMTTAALPVVAQGEATEVARRATFVRVENAAGAPIAGAVVTFVGGAPHLGVVACQPEVREVQSDARGRVQCKLAPGLCYVAWATAPADAAGRVAASLAQGWFGAGSLIVLRCNEPMAPTSIPVAVDDSWRTHGPLQFVALMPTPGVELPIARDAEQRLVLPPGPVQVIEVRTAAGAPLLHVPTSAEAVKVPPLQRVRVRVRDERQAPLAGVVIRHRVGRVTSWRLDRLGGVPDDRWRELGATDAEGECTVEVPYATDPLRARDSSNLLLFAGASGRPEVAGGVMQGAMFVDDRKDPKFAGDELPFTLRRFAPLAGSLGRVPAGTMVHLAAVCKLSMDRNGYLHDPRSYVTTVGPDGSFAFDAVPGELHSCRLSIVPPDGDTQRWPLFPARSERELPPEVAPGHGGVLRAEGWADVAMQWIEPNGGPARGVVCFVVPANNVNVLVRDAAVRVPLDARGSAALRLVPGKWAFVAHSSAGFGAEVLELAANERTATIAMQPYAVMRLELRDAAGAPVVGARVVARGTTMRGTGDPLQSMLQSMRDQWLGQWNALRTDAQGRVQVPFATVEGVTQKLGLSWDDGASEDVVLEATEDWRLVRPQ